MPLNNDELKLLISLAKRVLWSSPDIRQKIQAEGVNIVPSNFYSDVPTIDEIKTSFEYRNLELPVYEKIFDESVLQSYIQKLLPFSKEFNPPLDGDLENPVDFFLAKPGIFNARCCCVLQHDQML